jgi:hypothetical protein
MAAAAAAGRAGVAAGMVAAAAAAGRAPTAGRLVAGRAAPAEKVVAPVAPHLQTRHQWRQ